MRLFILAFRLRNARDSIDFDAFDFAQFAEEFSAVVRRVIGEFQQISLNLIVNNDDFKAILPMMLRDDAHNALKAESVTGLIAVTEEADAQFLRRFGFLALFGVEGRQLVVEIQRRQLVERGRLVAAEVGCRVMIG